MHNDHTPLEDKSPEEGDSSSEAPSSGPREAARKVSQESSPEGSQEGILRASRHYRRGNRFFASGMGDKALHEWKHAASIWRSAEAAKHPLRKGMGNLMAVLGLLITVVVFYNLLFTMFPRQDDDQMLLMGGESRSWWERFLDTGRDQQENWQRLGIREWWDQLRRSWKEDSSHHAGRREMGLPTVEKRWEDLLRRYGNWGPQFNYSMDYNLVSGYGLSRMGEYQRSVAIFEKGLLSTDKPEKRADLFQGLANTHYYFGYNLQEDGLAKYDLEMVRKASQAYEESIKIRPVPLSFGNLGWMHYLLGNYEQAIDYSLKALRMNDRLDYVRLNIGLVHLVQNNITESFRYYSAVISRNPPQEVYLGGITDLRELIRDNPGRHPFSYLMLGLLAAKDGQYDLAEDSLTRFVTSPNIGQRWRVMAMRILDQMTTTELER
ncbi:MAG: tetratricopeptide repeat protein [Deltaproteobacteria bacterium]|nr:tetratricopeptide repeat protein [Deltaproteobacteria bacterium]